MMQVDEERRKEDGRWKMEGTEGDKKRLKAQDPQVNGFRQRASAYC